MGVFPRQSDDAGTVGTSIDEIAQQDEPVMFGQGKLVQQILKLARASVNIPNGNNAPLHVQGQSSGADFGIQGTNPPKSSGEDVWVKAIEACVATVRIIGTSFE
jgi:hypothetical protein